MAIKMRHNRDEDAFCCECSDEQKDVLDMYDICIGDTILTICDQCCELVFNKTLSAICEKNGRVKSPRDMSVIRRRKWKNDPKFGGKFGGYNK